MDLLQSRLDRLRLVMFFIHHLVSGSIQFVKRVRMRRHFGLERLVLLDLGLQVGWILVALVGGRLELLHNPTLQLVCVALEVHVAARVLQTRSSRMRCLLEVLVASKHLQRKHMTS